MATVSASTVALNGQVYLAGTSDGLLVSLVAQRKSSQSVKMDIQPSYIATQHARKITCVVATADTFASAGDDCTIVVSQIGCLFGGNEMNRAGQRYRITGAHALPVTALVYDPSDDNVLVSASADGTVVMHRLHFVAGNSTLASNALPSLSLAQSMERMVRLPFAIASVCVLRPSDGSLFAAAGCDASGKLVVAVIDFGVTMRDGNGSGRPLQPFTVLALPSEVSITEKATVGIACVQNALVVSCGNGQESYAWDLSTLLKAMAIGRSDEDAIATKVEEQAEAMRASMDAVSSFWGTKEQVANALDNVIGSKAKPNDYYASLYSNFCWSTWARPTSCVVTSAPPKVSEKKNNAAGVESDSDNEESALVSTPGFGKRARKTKTRLTRAEAEAAEWARLAQAVDGNVDKPLFNTKEAIPMHLTALNVSKAILACDSFFACEPAAKAFAASSGQYQISAADEEEAAAVKRLTEQKQRNQAVQARIDALYAAVATAAASRKSTRDEESSPKGGKGRPTKKPTTEAPGKSVFSLT